MGRWSIAVVSVCLWVLVALPTASAKSVQPTALESTSDTETFNVDSKGRPRKYSKVTFGPTKVRGLCKKSNVHSILRRHLNLLRYCYEKQLIRKPDLAGKVKASWVIGEDGKVKAGVDTSGLELVRGCVASKISTMRFTKPEGGTCVVQMPFVFAK